MVGIFVHDFLFSGVCVFSKVEFLVNWVVYHWSWPFCCLLGNICKAIIKWASQHAHTTNFSSSPQLNPFTRRVFIPFILNVYAVKRILKAKNCVAHIYLHVIWKCPVHVHQMVHTNDPYHQWCWIQVIPCSLEEWLPANVQTDEERKTERRKTIAKINFRL